MISGQRILLNASLNCAAHVRLPARLGASDRVPIVYYACVAEPAVAGTVVRVAAQTPERSIGERPVNWRTSARNASTAASLQQIYSRDIRQPRKVQSARGAT